MEQELVIGYRVIPFLFPLALWLLLRASARSRPASNGHSSSHSFIREKKKEKEKCEPAVKLKCDTLEQHSSLSLSLSLSLSPPLLSPTHSALPLLLSLLCLAWKKDDDGQRERVHVGRQYGTRE